MQSVAVGHQRGERLSYSGYATKNDPRRFWQQLRPAIMETLPWRHGVAERPSPGAASGSDISSDGHLHPCSNILKSADIHCFFNSFDGFS